MMLLFFTAIALSDPSENLEIIYKEQTEIDFEEVEIEGNTIKPHGALIQERKGTAFNPLIELRLDFKVEMSQSISDIK